MEESIKPLIKVNSPVRTAMRKGLDFLTAIQAEDGSWRGDYSGPMFLLPMYISACHITRQEIAATRRDAMAAYLRKAQNPNGSIGLHIEDSGSMFTTVLSYAALRFLGVPRDDEALVRMRGWIATNGTALGAASWGKFFLALLNLYAYEGLEPILPELWLLPYAVPIHPGRMWCHCRQVYLPMAYLYGIKAQIPVDPLIRELRVDLYDRPFSEIDFSLHRKTIAPSDNRFPASRVLGGLTAFTVAFENHCPPKLRDRALAELFDHIQYEDEVTHYIDIGPVNSVLNTLVHFFKQPDGNRFKQSFAALDNYLCDAADGVKFNGYNSTALWDTAFCAQAISATPFAAEYQRELRRAYGYIRSNQVVEDVPNRNKFYRHASRGGWPFSDRAHGWPITDCTAEGFKAALQLEAIADELIDEDLLKDAVKLMLSFQNRDGGWSTYERKRGSSWLELLNPSRVFDNIMVDYSYVECTSACIQALALARGRFPMLFDREIERAIRRATRFIFAKQLPDGSWKGSWGVCFTYGTWFAVSGLIAAGVAPYSPVIDRACGFLMQHQNRDGGWGESAEGCMRGRYVRREESLVSNTAWALMTLLRAGLSDSAAAHRAARFLVARQDDNGDWPVEPLVGVFNKSALINYENYRRYFSIWALAEFNRSNPEKIITE